MHSLGFHHEQTRPDRDDHLTVDWVHTRVYFNSKVYIYYGSPNFCIKLNVTPQHWKTSWTLEDLSAATFCTLEGVTQTTVNFDNCVRHDAIVKDYGVEYDFNSIMHYELTRLFFSKLVVICILKSYAQRTLTGLASKCAHS